MKTSNVVVVLGGMALAGFVLASGDAPPTAPAVAVPAELASKAEAVTKALAGQGKQAKALAAVYLRAASIVETDREVIKTNADARDLILRATRLLSVTDGPIPEAFQTAAEGVIDAALGTDRTPKALTDETRRKLVDGYRAISQAAAEAE